MVEIWKNIPSFKKIYQVSNLGCVRSLNHRAKIHQLKGRPIKPIQRPDGYLVVNLKQHSRRIHRLVLEAFIGSCPRGYECRHLDGNRQNNKLTNLTWGTRSENAQDRIKHGYKSTQMKQVRRSDGKVFESATAAAKAINTSQGNISCICRGLRKTLKGYSFEYMEKLNVI